MGIEAANDNGTRSFGHDMSRLVMILGGASFLLSAFLAGSYTVYPDSPFREYDLKTLGPIIGVSGVVTIGGLLASMLTQPAQIEKC